MRVPNIVSENPTGCGVSGYGLYNILVEKQGKLKGLEIGCDRGNTTSFLLEALPNITLYGVDPYTNYIDWNNHVLHERDDTYMYFKSRVEPYGERFKLIRKTSSEAINCFEDEYFDFIFIDGLHTYDQVKEDCKNYYPKLKKGGLFAGHDFLLIEEVNKAVKEFASQIPTEISTTIQDAWYWFK